jgi:hypothetical protein
VESDSKLGHRAAGFSRLSEGVRVRWEFPDEAGTRVMVRGSFDFATFFASEESRSAQDDRGKEGLGALLRMTGEKKDWVVR